MQRSTEVVHKEIVAKYLQNSSASTKAIANVVKTTMWTVRRIIKRLNEEGTVKEKGKSGRPRGISNKNIEKKILRLLHRDPTQSIRDTVKKASTTHTMVQRVKKFNSLTTYKKHKKPKRTEKQQKTALRRSRKFYYQMLSWF